MEGDPHQLLLTVHPDGPDLLPQIGALGCRKEALALSWSWRSKIYRSCSWISLSQMGQAISTRRWRLRVIRSAEAMKYLAWSPPAKDIDSGVFQVAAHNAGDLDVLRLQKHPRADAADAPDNHLNLHPCLGGLPEFVDDLPPVMELAFDAEVALGAPLSISCWIMAHSWDFRPLGATSREWYPPPSCR